MAAIMMTRGPITAPAIHALLLLDAGGAEDWLDGAGETEDALVFEAVLALDEATITQPC
jgi:hypothetical protein